MTKYETKSKALRRQRTMQSRSMRSDNEKLHSNTDRVVVVVVDLSRVDFYPPAGHWVTKLGAHQPGEFPQMYMVTHLDC